MFEGWLRRDVVSYRSPRQPDGFDTGEPTTGFTVEAARSAISLAPVRRLAWPGLSSEAISVEPDAHCRVCGRASRAVRCRPACGSASGSRSSVASRRADEVLWRGWRSEGRGCRTGQAAFVKRDSQPRRSCSPSREESNDGTHETKPALLRRWRMGPEPGQGVSRPENRLVPDRVAGERAKAHPVAGTPRLGESEAAESRERESRQGIT